MGLHVFDKHSTKEWIDVFKSFPQSQQDIYFLPEYYKTWIEHEQADLRCFYYTDNGIELLYPFFQKRINDPNFDAEYFDIFSAYGYGGIVSNKNGITDGDVIHQFNIELNKWCVQNNIVAEFIRENPMIQNGYRKAERAEVRQNVYVDTTTPYTFLCKNVKENYNKSVKSGLQVEIDDELKNMDEFIRLYRITSERLCVQQFYRFPDEYFYNIKKYLGNNAKLLHVKKGHEFIASTIVLYHNKRASIHLCASDFKYQDCRLNDFMFINAINEAVRMKMDYICLGGGTGNDPKDTLFRFKKKFGKIRKTVKIVKVLHNSEIYDQLVAEWTEKNPGKSQLYKNYFLKYRL